MRPQASLRNVYDPRVSTPPSFLALLIQKESPLQLEEIPAEGLDVIQTLEGTWALSRGRDPSARFRLRADSGGVRIQAAQGLRPPLPLPPKLDPGESLELSQGQLSILDSQALPSVLDLGTHTRGMELLTLGGSPRSRLEAWLAFAIQALEAERGFLLTWPEERGPNPKLRSAPLRARIGFPGAEIEETLSRTAIEIALEAGPSCFLSTDPRLREAKSVRLQGLRWVAVAPLSSKGVLYLDSRTQARTHPFSPTRLQWVCTYLGESLDADWKEQEQERQLARAKLEIPEKVRPVFGPSPSSQALQTRLARLAPEPGTVLLQGETGTGKELLAREIHRLSPRAHLPFVAFQAGRTPPDLVANELFGHAAGAFTGADRARPGRFQLAEGGTLFLDELGELPLGAQVQLLRVLEERVVEPLGSGEPIPVEFRLLAATHRDLEGMVQRGEFREDLYYRLAVHRIRIPALRDRREDLSVLVESLLKELRRQRGTGPLRASKELLVELSRRPFPGNLRQLRNLLEGAVLETQGETLEVEHLPVGTSPEASLQVASSALDLKPWSEARDQFERGYLEAALQRAQGDPNRAAKLAKMSRSTFYRRLQTLGISIRKAQPNQTSSDPS